MLLLSLLLGVLSAVAYGCSTAVQHAAVHDASGNSDAKGLLNLLRNPRWLMSIGGDGLGLVLQVAALSTGPVVLIQPLQVLSLPIAMPLRARLGGPRPTARDWWAVVAVVLGLGLFLLLVGDPGAPTRHHATATLVVAAGGVGLGGVLALVALGLPPRTRAVVFGALGGMLFAVVAVLIDETSTVLSARPPARAGPHAWGAADRRHPRRRHARDDAHPGRVPDRRARRGLPHQRRRRPAAVGRARRGAARRAAAARPAARRGLPGRAGRGGGWDHRTGQPARCTHRPADGRGPSPDHHTSPDRVAPAWTRARPTSRRCSTRSRRSTTPPTPCCPAASTGSGDGAPGGCSTCGRANACWTSPPAPRCRASSSPAPART